MKKKLEEESLRKEQLLYKLENNLKEITGKYDLIKDIKISNETLDEKKYQKQHLENELFLLKENLKEKDKFSQMTLKFKIIEIESQLKLLDLLLNEEKEKFLSENKEVAEEYNKNLKEKENLKNEIIELKERIERIRSEKLSMTYIKDEDFVKIKGGKYKPSFANEEKEVFDMEVCKYVTTQVMWAEVMGYNPSKFKSNYEPVDNVDWWKALEYCNKLSEKYYLEPVYDLSKSKEGILMIKESNGKTVHAYEANFKNTEGFRLPTEVEWEWFTKVKKNIKNTRLGNNSLKKINQLEFLNVGEWCYDTTENIENGKLHICRFCNEYRRIRRLNFEDINLFWRGQRLSTKEDIIAFRVVRTIK